MLNEKIKNKRPTEQLVTRVSKEISKKFKALAAEEGKTVTDVLRELAEAYCED